MIVDGTGVVTLVYTRFTGQKGGVAEVELLFKNMKMEKTCIQNVSAKVDFIHFQEKLNRAALHGNWQAGTL